MIDPFVLLTPILLLVIIALLGFLGCDRVLGLAPIIVNPPQIFSIMPTSGTPLGGDTVTINGVSFSSPPSVTFGTTGAVSVTFVNSSQITAITPQHSPGKVDVTVTNPNGSASTLPSSFIFSQVTLAQPPQPKQQPGNPPISVTLPGAQTGSLIVVTVSWGTGTISVSDGSNTYKSAGTGNWSGHQAQMFYAVNTVAGNLTITASGPGTTGPCSLCATEYLYADQSPAQAIYSFASQASPSTGGALTVTVNSANANDLIYAVAFAQNGNLAVTGSFTKETSTGLGALSLLVADKLVTSPGPSRVGITNGVSTSPWVILATAIKHV